MSSLYKKQVQFAWMAARLLDKAKELGYEVTTGDAYRDPRVHGEVGVRKGYGHRNSNHKQRLAIDLNLFKDGQYLETTKAHQALGEWWESQGGSWGGRFKGGDANHYSLEYNGMR